MNKKIKVIELLNINAQIENSEKIPQKIKYNGDVYELQMSRDYYSCEKHEYLTNMANNKRLDIFLNDYVEILEDNTEEIEELKRTQNVYDMTLECYHDIEKKISNDELADKINELVKAVNKLRKEKE